MTKPFQSYFLLGGQILAHAALLFSLFTFSGLDWLIVLLMYFIGGCLGGSITYHRLLSHGAFNAPKWFTYLGSLCGAFFLVGSPLAWSNNHKAHHRFVDTDKDPHSPQHLGFARVQWLSMLSTHNSFKYSVRNLTPFQVNLHKYYPVIQIAIAVVLLLTLGLHGWVLFHLVPSAVIWNMMSLVNTVNHFGSLGYRNYESKDSSTNSFITGYITWGEGWHNNHHAYPGFSNFGKRWWEFDPSYWIIRLLEKKS